MEENGARVVKVQRSVESSMQSLQEGSTMLPEGVMEEILAFRIEINTRTLTNYAPVKERGGKFVLPFDLVTAAQFRSDTKIVEAPIAIVQKPFKGTNLASLCFSPGVNIREVFREYFGSIYKLSRYGVFNEDWPNLEDAIVSTGPGTPPIIFLDPFYCKTTRREMEELRQKFEGFLEANFRDLMARGFPFWSSFKDEALYFVRKYDFFSTFGADIPSAKRVADFLNF
jgi:hypothetical protein